MLHGLSDRAASELLQRVAQAAQPVGARVLILEALRPSGRNDPALAGMDLQMAVCTEGRERSLPEWRALCALCDQAGLSLQEVVPLPTLASILVLA